jgi:hypothetical protein
VATAVTAPLSDVLRRALADLARSGLSCALIGGVAVSVRAVERLTRDLDFAVSVRDDAEAEHAVRELGGVGYAIDVVLENTATQRLATVRLRSPLDQVTRVDLLFASCGIEPEIVALAETIDLGGSSCRVAVPGHLIALKVLARSERRPQDDLDLAALIPAASPTDLDLARAALQRITEQRCARDKDLSRELDQALLRWRK